MQPFKILILKNMFCKAIKVVQNPFFYRSAKLFGTLTSTTPPRHFSRRKVFAFCGIRQPFNKKEDLLKFIIRKLNSF